MQRHVCVWSLVCSLVLVSFIFGLAPVLARGNDSLADLPPSQLTGVGLANDGSLALVDDAALPPPVVAGFARWGLFVASVQPLDRPTTRLRLDYNVALPAGCAASIDVRGSADGQRWSAWQTERAAGSEVTFDAPVRWVQYRARLFGTTLHSPVVRSVALVPLAYGSAATTQAEPVAPTFRLRATRMGMVGGRTANGHIIRPRDHYVSLPSWSSLASRGGYEYQVRVTYNGRSAVAPVWDVGPWNTRDNYWDVERDQYPELPQGWPQDHAAYYDGHNGGYAEKGYVRFPTAIDVGDGVWWDALGINGDQAEVEVTFLWMGRDPLAAPPEPTPTATPMPTETPVPTETPSPTPTPEKQEGAPIGNEPKPTDELPTATPTATAGETSVPKPTDEPVDALPTPTAGESPTPSAEPTATPSAEPTVTASPEPTPGEAPTQDPSPGATPKPTV